MKHGDKIVYVDTYKNYVGKYIDLRDNGLVSILLSNNELKVVPRKYVIEYDEYVVNHLRRIAEALSFTKSEVM